VNGRRAEKPDRWTVVMSARPGVRAEQLRALRLLAACPVGCSEAIVLAYGFEIELVVGLVRDGLATTQRGTVRADKRPVEVTWVTITDAGQRALAAK
jgi:hypothetical protein